MPTKTIMINPTPKFRPTHIRGDRDFHGNGPRVNVSARLYIRNRNQLWCRVWMRATETKRDWTTAEGSADYFVYNGEWDKVDRINHLVSDPYSLAAYTDTDHRDDVLSMPGTELVKQFTVTGDTRGNEAGTRTGVVVHFNPIEFEYEPVQLPPDKERITVDVEPTPRFIPQHVGGDRDFHGHGPNVDVATRIGIRNKNEIWARVWMHAMETKSDWTEVEGSEDFMIYRHPTDIERIISDSFSGAHYRDNDHQQDVLHLAGGDLVDEFAVIGDTRGNEAGTRTGVSVRFNPITFIAPRA